MATYSHSKISMFENCPYSYKLKYIDKIEVDIPATIEMFMGDLVHKTLEKLYKDLKYQKLNSKEEILSYFNELWENQYSNNILITKLDIGITAENYRKMGEKFISDYYEKYKPFNQITIVALESQDKMTLPDGNQWHVRIDKLGFDSKGNYYVCDYKTNSYLKTQQEADSDRQLAMYSVWVKNKFRDAKSVKLLWHMLAFGKEVISERTDEELSKLQQNVIEIIRLIETAEKENNFPRKKSALCNYCLYKSICPSFKHHLEIKNEIKLKEDEGLKLVDEYAEIKNKVTELEKKQEELKERMIRFAKQKDIDVIYGSNMKCSLKEFEKIVMPEGKNRFKFINLMKEKGIYEECSMICYQKINSKIIKNEIDEEFRKIVNIEKDWKLTLTKKRDD
jgi:putative RecB family exonuclease